MKRVVFLDYLRVAAIFMVLVVHSCEQYYFNSEGFYIASASDAFWVSAIDSAVRCCVPLFVMASAYLLFPIGGLSTGVFLKRRLPRVLVPFVVWSALYTFFWGGNWGELAFNFPMMTSGHLWFVPMLVGLYLLMPLLSPWAERASEREVRGWLILWLVTTLFPFARELWRALYGTPSYGAVPYLWGECPWNAFGLFHYVSGFFGYLLLGFYFRRFAPEKVRGRTILAALGIGLVGYLITVVPFYLRIPFRGGYPIALPYSSAVQLEMSWDFCSTGVVLMSAAVFTLFHGFKAEGFIYRRLILPLSGASFGVYLLHMFVLVKVAAYLKPLLPTPLAIFSIAAGTFLLSSSASLILRRLPFVGRWICG